MPFTSAEKIDGVIIENPTRIYIERIFWPVESFGRSRMGFSWVRATDISLLFSI